MKHKENLSALVCLKESLNIKEGMSVGAVWTVYQLAKEIGIEKVLGRSFNGKLALWQVIARVIEQGSRLSAVRLAKIHAACDVLDINRGFDENDLYENLGWLADNQQRLEIELLTARRSDSKPRLFLYDVTSSYLEGNQNYFGEYGYNRDKKTGKKQIVIGLLCDEYGEPVSTEVFRGNTKDTQTFQSQVKKAAELFGCKEVTFVGDRGMIKSTQIDVIKDEDFHYISAITKPQIESLIRKGIFQYEFFEENICEIEYDDIRYILRRNPIRAEEMSKSRMSKQEYIERLVKKKNLYLDGCYVIKTDLSESAADKQTVHDRYKELAQVEQAFRDCKTVSLEVRPVFVRSKKSTQGHVLVVMLAYMIIRKLRQAWANLDMTVEEGLKQLSTLCSAEIKIDKKYSCLKIPIPRKESQTLLQALKIKLPSALPHRDVRVVTRKKLPERRLTA
ncbi:MAG: transposase [Candidatus Omnitrophica bacterium]|nr:transposase [Candidatus Omnitrophota bacterium]